MNLPLRYNVKILRIKILISIIIFNIYFEEMTNERKLWIMLQRQNVTFNKRKDQKYRQSLWLQAKKPIFNAN